jgi:hypothetical protein
LFSWLLAFVVNLFFEVGGAWFLGVAGSFSGSASGIIGTLGTDFFENLNDY